MDCYLISIVREKLIFNDMKLKTAAKNADVITSYIPGVGFPIRMRNLNLTSCPFGGAGNGKAW